MRQFVLLLILSGALAARAQSTASATNSVDLGKPGILEIPTPANWTFANTNLNLPGDPRSVELASPGGTARLRITVFWDGFGGTSRKPTQADFENKVSDNCQNEIVPRSVEKKVVLETLHGKTVSGTYARFTEADWRPMLKDQYRNIALGMFRCGNLWGNFSLLTNSKDGPEVKDGLKIMESLQRQP